MSSVDGESYEAIKDLLSGLIEQPIIKSMEGGIQPSLNKINSSLGAISSSQDKVSKRQMDGIASLLNDELSGLEGRLSQGQGQINTKLDEMVASVSDVSARQEDIKREFEMLGSKVREDIDKLEVRLDIGKLNSLVDEVISKQEVGVRMLGAGLDSIVKTIQRDEEERKERDASYKEKLSRLYLFTFLNSFFLLMTSFGAAWVFWS